jgi:hypothetical protein
MPSNLPLATVVVEIVRHTPAYVWAILAALIALGALQWRDHVVSRARLAIAPLALGAYSVWGATLAFGLHTRVVAAWALGSAIALVANRWLRWPRAIGVEGAGRYLLAGSPWPMAAMLAVFMLRYAVAVTLVFHHDWAADPLFSAAVAGLYGALSGLFAARALRILRSDAAPARFATA